MSLDAKSSKGLSQVIERVQLRTVYIKDSSFVMNAFPEVINEKTCALNHKFSFNHQVVDESDRKELICFIQIELFAMAKKETKLYEAIGDDKLLSGSANFAVRYSISDLSNFEEDALETFTRLNGMFNAYPFIREHTHSTFAKMGIQGFFLPLLKPPVSKEANKK